MQRTETVSTSKWRIMSNITRQDKWWWSYFYFARVAFYTAPQDDDIETVEELLIRCVHRISYSNQSVWPIRTGECFTCYIYLHVCENEGTARSKQGCFFSNGLTTPFPLHKVFWGFSLLSSTLDRWLSDREPCLLYLWTYLQADDACMRPGSVIFLIALLDGVVCFFAANFGNFVRKLYKLLQNCDRAAVVSGGPPVRWTRDRSIVLHGIRRLRQVLFETFPVFILAFCFGAMDYFPHEVDKPSYVT